MATVKNPSSIRITNPGSINYIGDTVRYSITSENPNYTHKVYVSITDGSITGEFEIGSDIKPGNTAWYPTEIEKEKLIGYMLMSATGYMQLKCATFEGDTLIGNSVTTVISVVVPEDTAPVINDVTISDINVSSSKIGSYLKSVSSIKVSVKATPHSSTGLKLATVTLDTFGTVSSSFAIATGTADINLGTAYEAGTFEGTVTVRDTRGMETKRGISITVIPYESPNIKSFKVKRVTSSGVESEEGTYAQFTYGYEIDPLDNKNDKSMKIDYYEKGSDESTAKTLTTDNTSYSVTDKTYKSSVTFSADKAWTFRITVSDGIYKATSYRHIEAGTPLIDIYSDGTGIAIGKVAEKSNLVDISLPTKFNFPTTFSYGENSAGAIILTQSTINPNSYTDPGYYVFGSNSYISGTPRASGAPGSLEIFKEGTTNSYLRQVLTRCSSGAREVWERIRYGGSWEDWQPVIKYGQRELWSGGSHMNGSQSVTLSEPISEQPNGVVLLFSGYTNSSSTVNDWYFQHFFVSKYTVASFEGQKHTFMLGDNGKFATVGMKYLSINDDTIVGNANNTSYGTGTSGIKYDNRAFVLRKVIGV